MSSVKDRIAALNKSPAAEPVAAPDAALAVKPAPPLQPKSTPPPPPQAAIAPTAVSTPETLSVAQKIALLKSGGAKPEPATPPAGHAAPQASPAAPAAASAASPESTSASASTPEGMSVAQKIALLKAGSAAAAPGLPYASPSAPAAHAHLESSHPPPNAGAPLSQPPPPTSPHHPTTHSPSSSSSSSDSCTHSSSPSSSSQPPPPQHPPSTPSTDRRASGSLADKIAALQRASQSPAPEPAPRPTPHKLDPSKLSPALAHHDGPRHSLGADDADAGEGKEEDRDAKPRVSSLHRPSAAMMKLQGGINLSALMGAPRPHSISLRDSISHREEDEADAEEGEGAEGGDSGGAARASMGGGGSRAAAAVEDDRRAAVEALVHPSLSRPTTGPKKRPAAARKFAADD